MKKILFCVTVAFLCCGSSALNAQIKQSAGNPTPAPKLVATQFSFEDEDFPTVNGEVENPFNGLSNPPQPAPPPPPSVTQPAPSAPVQSEVSEDPQSLPVGRRHRQRRAVVDTMANYGHIASIPNAASTPIDWCYGSHRTPNPVAEVLLRQECVEGLWDGYEAQRAAECAHMWKKLTATKKCRGCHKCMSGCSGCAGGCTSGGCTAAPVNRYQSDCDMCTQCAAAKNAEELQQSAQMASAVAPAVVK